MEITQSQYGRVAHLLPVPRGNVSLSNLRVLNAVLHVAVHGCKWRRLPPRYGNWHTVYVRVRRWQRNGVLDRVFEHLQREGIVRLRMGAVPPGDAGDEGRPDESPGDDKTPRFVWLPRMTERP